jgi:hypothetical protein
MRRLIFVITFALVAFGGGTCNRERGASAEVELAAAPDETCHADSACGTGFCDRGVCRATAGVYGRTCKPAPRGPDGVRDGKLSVCGAYLCIDGRCRSCQSDGECKSEVGSPRCYKLEGEPGMRCGRPAQ